MDLGLPQLHKIPWESLGDKFIPTIPNFDYVGGFKTTCNGGIWCCGGTDL